MLFCGDFIFQNGLDVLRVLELQMERLNVHCGNMHASMEYENTCYCKSVELSGYAFL